MVRYSNAHAVHIENQLIFHPLRNIENKGKRENQFNSSKTRIIYSQPLKKYHKLFFNSKINFLYKSLISQINPSSIKITIATTLYSDGAIALKLFQEFNIPYVVCVRHTDINFFSKYRSDMNSLLKKILQNAKKVVFISPTLELKAKKIKKSASYGGFFMFWMRLIPVRWCPAASTSPTARRSKPTG